MRGDDLQGVTRLSIGVLCVAAFVLIMIILSGNELDDTSGKAIATAVALAFLSLTAVAGSHLTLRQPQLSLFGFLTIGISALAFLVTAAAIWSGWESDNWKPAIYTLLVAFACGHTSVLLARREEAEEGLRKLIRGATVALLWLLVAMAIIEISQPGNDVDPQGMGVIAVLYALGTILLPLLDRLGPTAPSRPRPQGQATGELPLDHVCLVWPGTAASAVEALNASGAQVVEGPVPRNGARGPGQSVYYREPDGSLVELIAYG